MFKQIFNIIIFYKDYVCGTKLVDLKQYSLDLFLKYLSDLNGKVYKPIIKDEFQWNK